MPVKKVTDKSPARRPTAGTAKDKKATPTKKAAKPASEPSSKPAAKSAASAKQESRAKTQPEAKSGEQSRRIPKKKPSAEKSIFTRITSKTLIRAAIVVVVLCLLVSVVTNSADWSLSGISRSYSDSAALRGSGKEFPLTLSGSLSSRFSPLAGGVAVLTDTSLSVYSTRGKTAVVSPHYMATPAMKTCGHYALVYDVNSTKYRLETASETLVTGKSKDLIINACVSRNGSYAIITQYAGALAHVIVYDRSGAALFGWTSVDYYITAAALNDTGSELALCGLNVEDGRLKSSIIVLSVSGSKELARQEYPGCMLIDIERTAGGCWIAAGESEAFVVSSSGKEFTRIELGGEVSAYDVDYDSGAVFFSTELEGDTNGSLLALDTKGRERFRLSADAHAVGVSSSKKNICLLSQGSLVVYDSDGEKKGEYPATTDSRSVLTIGSDAFILGNTILRKQPL